MDIESRFWSKVDKSGDCWVWVAGKWSSNPKLGYGQFWKDGSMHKAYRVAWELTHGPIPPGAHVMHVCDNPPCVNPEHLVLGTHGANMADKKRKGRSGPRTHCPAGHEYTEANSYVRKDGGRNCRACARRRQLEYTARAGRPA